MAHNQIGADAGADATELMLLIEANQELLEDEYPELGRPTWDYCNEANFQQAVRQRILLIWRLNIIRGLLDEIHEAKARLAAMAP